MCCVMSNRLEYSYLHAFEWLKYNIMIGNHLVIFLSYLPLVKIYNPKLKVVHYYYTVLTVTVGVYAFGSIAKVVVIF